MRCRHTTQPYPSGKSIPAILLGPSPHKDNVKQTVHQDGCQNLE